MDCNYMIGSTSAESKTRESAVSKSKVHPVT